MQPNCLNRRALFTETGLGLSGVALAALLARDGSAAGSAAGDEPDGQPHFPPRAKNVIWLFMRGGFSHLETFDPKPTLDKYAGKTLSETPWKYVQDPERLKKLRVAATNQNTQRNRLYEPQTGFRKYGESGIEVSDFFPHIGNCIDDIAVVRSMWTTDDNHGAQYQFETGRHNLDGSFPNIGAWVTYGLGSLNDNLPSYVKMGVKYPQVHNDGSYLGRAYDAVRLAVDPQNPLPYARPALDLSREEQRLQFDLVKRLNQIEAVRSPADEALRARIKSYELAFRMQTAVPEVIRFEDETAATQQLYGLQDSKTKAFGMQVLAARRFVEKGVRFVKIMHGAGAAGAWDAHGNVKSNHTKLAAQVDKPVAGLLTDLKQRGMLEETIVVFATEFGRTPKINDKGGRDHWGNLCTLAFSGGGLKMGQIVGKSDKNVGQPAEDPVSPNMLLGTVMNVLFDTGQVRLLSGIPEDVKKAVVDSKPIPQLV